MVDCFFFGSFLANYQILKKIFFFTFQSCGPEDIHKNNTAEFLSRETFKCSEYHVTLMTSIKDTRQSCIKREEKERVCWQPVAVWEEPNKDNNNRMTNI